MVEELLLTGNGASGCAEALICLNKVDRSRVGARMRDLAVAVALIQDIVSQSTRDCKICGQPCLLQPLDELATISATVGEHACDHVEFFCCFCVCCMLNSG